MSESQQTLLAKKQKLKTEVKSKATTGQTEPTAPGHGSLGQNPVPRCHVHVHTCAHTYKTALVKAG